MADELSKREPLDLQKINFSERLELRWWCVQLGCREEELREAVRAVGTSAAAVRKYLRR